MPIKSIFTTFLASAVLLLAATDAFAQSRAELRAQRMAVSEATDFNMGPLLDPNTATEAQLSAVAGLSAANVQAILSNRPFATPSELDAVIGEGRGEEEMFDIYSAVFVKVNLNRGDTEDFMLVPSTLTADHLAREFEEYRPYRSMNDFSPEMAKYVSAKEVAFLERFVIIE